MKHTPGPWKGRGKWPTNIKNEDGEMIATVWNISEDVAPHNANLIAAAPDLLAALVAVMEHYPNAISWAEDGGAYSREDVDIVYSVEEQARQALAAAKGNQIDIR